MKSSRAVPWIVATSLLVLLCCLAAMLLGAAGVIGAARWFEQSPPVEQNNPKVGTPGVLPDETPGAVSPDSLPEMQALLENTLIPVHDRYELARRLQGIQADPLALPGLPANHPLRAQAEFSIVNQESNRTGKVSAALRYRTEHLYFWVQEGLAYEDEALAQLAETFENQIYPTNRAYFGSEWTPGIDGDPRLHILYASGLGSNVVGYFYSVDQVHRAIAATSNEREMFYLNADNAALDEEYTYSVLAHEFQHMIHWYQDQNEETWLSEGLSQLASYLNGYNPGGFEQAYIPNPDLQLNDWPVSGDTAPSYGAAYLFTSYIAGRFGEDFTRQLVAHPDNGLHGLDAVLGSSGERNPASGDPLTADDVFLDWTIASYLHTSSPADERYQYRIFSGAPAAQPTETVNRCPASLDGRSVSQYGVDYIAIECPGQYRLHFAGAQSVPVLPVEPHSGRYAFWSNRADESNTSLSRSFDFRGQTGSLTLDYWTWYDIEKDYDYVYLSASTDGQSWQVLEMPAATRSNPTGQNYAAGYTGTSGWLGQWVRQRVDLSRFAGQQVTLRFDYVTDLSVHGEGFLLDDVQIPEIGYSEDFETGSGGWQGQGFVRLANRLPQTFQLALISHSRQVSVEVLELGSTNTFDLLLSMDVGIERYTLVVAAAARHTRQPAQYQIVLTPVQ